MKDLRLPTNELDFEELAQLGRSLIPTLAPEWTDHNTHDPGIMLVELLAWIAEAQMYALGRTSRDERRAYARLLGVEPRGPIGARGLIWPTDPGGDVGVRADTPLPSGTAVTSTRPNTPVFHTTQAIELTAARLVGLATRFADGSTRDWTRANSRDRVTFMPFGASPTPEDRLRLRFEWPTGDAPRTDGVLALGVETPATPDGAVAAETSAAGAPARLHVSLEDSDGKRPVRVVKDTTSGLLHSGVLLLGVGGARPRGRSFVLSIGSATFLRPPRVQRIAPNVLPVEQVTPVFEEVSAFGQGLPDQVYGLKSKGLVFPVDELSFTVKLFDEGAWRPWRLVDDLRAQGPHERCAVLDVTDGTLRFGNGINGRRPPDGAPLQVTYRVSEGSRGNLPSGLGWIVSAIAGNSWTNGEPMRGGRETVGLGELRALARARSREARPLVTIEDLETAARSIPDLGVARAIELTPRRGERRVRGTRVLVAVGPQDSEADPADAEDPDWLDEIRRQLAPRLPLGERLSVVSPRYVTVRIAARLVAGANLKPEDVATRAAEELRRRLALVDATTGDPVWPFGRDLTAFAVRGWLRNVAGVARVLEVTLFKDGEDAGDHVALGRLELPRLRLGEGDVVVERPPLGARR